MKFSYSWLKEFTSINDTPEKLAEILTLHSFETKAIQKSQGDVILDADILPNRAHDVQSHLGLAQEVAVLKKNKIKIPAFDFREAGAKKTADLVKVSVRNSAFAPRYIARVVQGVKMKETPLRIRQKLETFNINPHNLVVDILNYVMLEMGQPMHVFDYDKLAGQGKKEIIVRPAAKGESIKTLDGASFKLNEKILVIADGAKPVAVAGIKGGFDTSVDADTKTFVIESANFDAQLIRQESKLLGITTDASMRFSQGLDPNLAETGMNRALNLLQEFGGGDILKGAVDVYPKKSLARTIKLNIEKANKIIGAKLSAKELVDYLRRQNFEIKKAARNFILVKIPTERLDLEIDEDLIEEIARLVGFQNLKGVLPHAQIQAHVLEDIDLISEKIKNFLPSQGLSESYNYSFIGDADITRFDLNENNLWELENPVSDESRFLRSSLVFNLLKNVKNNFRFFAKGRLFEIGKIFQKQEGPKELLALGAVFAARNPKENRKGQLFFEAKGMLDGLFENLGVVDYFYDDANARSLISPQLLWQEGRMAEIKIGKEGVGFIGEVRPQILARLDIKGRAVALDLNLAKLTKYVEEEKEYLEIPKFPAVLRDLSILVSPEIRVTEVLNVIYGAGVELIDDVDLIDFYDEDLEGKFREMRNLVFRIVFQGDHTLTDEEVKTEEEKIKKALIEELGAEIR